MVPGILAHGSSEVSIIYLAKYLHSDLVLKSLVFFVVLTCCCVLMLMVLFPSKHICVPVRGIEVTPTSQSCSQKAAAWPLPLHLE